MIYFIYGKDIEKAREKTQSIIATLRKKKPDALFYRITSLNFEDHSISNLAGAQGLFESKYIVFLDNLFEKKEIKEQVMDNLAEISASDNVFIFLEKDVDKKTLGFIEKKAEKVQEVGETKVAKKAEYNVFALSDALLEKNKKDLWLLLLESKKRDGAPEEIHGVLWWQMKTLALAKEAKTAEEAGLSPFVFSKAKRAGNNFEDGELSKKLNELVVMYHEAHRGEVDLWKGMEEWVLRS